MPNRNGLKIHTSRKNNNELRYKLSILYSLFMKEHIGPYFINNSLWFDFTYPQRFRCTRLLKGSADTEVVVRRRN